MQPARMGIRLHRRGSRAAPAPAKHQGQTEQGEPAASTGSGYSAAAVVTAVVIFFASSIRRHRCILHRRLRFRIAPGNSRIFARIRVA